MPESVDRFRFDPHATGEEELARRRAVAYHISGYAHWEGIKVSEAPCARAQRTSLGLGWLAVLTRALGAGACGRPPSWRSR
jgi:hypothetical protein